ncbi:putative nad dependent epimerase [Phaeomoniella chlamydospora]|uniref:Putative nad dependent epimerase n=1 Tax=Phaeomoniella chlamydospora TaxID=158046 RepID=A0A0G2GXG5_PHACM|nr:putative nad dependent epimerase [Phaeomoniella chlamydospora]
MPLFQGKILVTGATGIVGTAIVLEIAKAGFKVRGSTRSASKAEQWSAKYPDVGIEWVYVQDQKADPSEGIYDEAVVGCDAAIHVAGPYTLTHKSGEEIMVPQLNGIKSILSACHKEKSIKRLVYTSTVAAINPDPHLGLSPAEQRAYTEDDWNPTTWEKGSSSSGQHMPVTSYCCGKTLAEKYAWEFMSSNQPSFDLVALCPATGYGPPLQVLHSLHNLDAASARLWSHITHAQTTIPGDPSPVFTNVYDTAEMHLNALTWPSAAGKRFQIVSGSYSYARIFSILKSAFPEHAHRFPVIEDQGLPLNPCFTADCTRAKRELGFRPRSLEETVIDQAKVLFDLEKKE